MLLRRLLLPDANRAVERADRGIRILHHPRAPARTHRACARRSVFLLRSDRHHGSRFDPRGQKFEKCITVGYCRRIHPDGLHSGDS